jgi:hypothetical protein
VRRGAILPPRAVANDDPGKRVARRTAGDERAEAT